MSEDDNILLIDAGNSCLKWALRVQGGLTAHGQCIYARSQPDFGLGAALEGIDAKIAAVYAASVAGAGIEEALSSVVRQQWDTAVHYQAVDDGLCGLQVSYQEPQHLGVDRWLAMVGACAMHDGAVCVADCGTALTLDTVAVDGRHLGGIILPGYRLLTTALRRETARIDAHEQPLPASFFGNSTASSVNAGCTLALAAAVDRFVAESEKALGAAVLVFVTGGDRQRLIEFTRCEVVEVPDLVLLGLHQVLLDTP